MTEKENIEQSLEDEFKNIFDQWCKSLNLEPEKLAPLYSEFRPLRRDSLCPSGAAFVSTMPAPSSFCGGACCEILFRFRAFHGID